jgi:hypothetical protein
LFSLKLDSDLFFMPILWLLLLFCRQYLSCFSLGLIILISSSCHYSQAHGVLSPPCEGSPLCVYTGVHSDLVLKWMVLLSLDLFQYFVMKMDTVWKSRAP